MLPDQNKEKWFSVRNNQRREYPQPGISTAENKRVWHYALGIPVTGYGSHLGTHLTSPKLIVMLITLNGIEFDKSYV